MADSFHNVRLSDCVLAGASGGPGFKTTVIETASGDEYRNVEWSRQRGRWNIGYTNDHAKIEEIIAFFHARRGRAYGFRFKDWSDYKVDNVFAVGDGVQSVFQVAKIYGSSPYAFSRPLTRLVAGGVVRVDGAIETPAIDINTGKLGFSLPPADGAQISFTGEFDVPVRFDIDDLPIEMITQNLSRLESVPIIEIRDRGES